MATDLPEVGRKNATDPKAGYQAMVYGYDQLNRIKETKSLTSYSSETGFEARPDTEAAFDASYTYDPNGNLLSLHRYDNNASLMDDLDYVYTDGTNQLLKTGDTYEKAVSMLKVYDENPLVADGELYQQIIVEGSAYLPSGSTAELRATEEIEIKPGFTVESGANFSAEIVPNETIDVSEGQYEYDLTGNLISDKGEGTTIEWTPYGKVKKVAKGNGDATVFLYDATGNRRFKSVTVGEETRDTYYVRDASGNVMATYDQNGELTEQFIYGSSRLGKYLGNTDPGQEKLGQRQYELTNHLGNVMAVVSDKINIIPDGEGSGELLADVISVSDYYPFGLQMNGRTFSAGTYRYGFNGKEKDDNGNRLSEQSAQLSNCDFGHGGLCHFKAGSGAALAHVSLQHMRATYTGCESGCENNPVIYKPNNKTENGKRYKVTFDLNMGTAQEIEVSIYEQEAFGSSPGPREKITSVVYTQDDPPTDGKVSIYFTAGATSHSAVYIRRSNATTLTSDEYITVDNYTFYEITYLETDAPSQVTYDYGFRIYNPSIGKFLSVDPLASSYPWYTPYQFAGNKPIMAIDLDGLEEYVSIVNDQTGTTQLISVDDEYGVEQINSFFLAYSQRTSVDKEWGFDWDGGYNEYTQLGDQPIYKGLLTIHVEKGGMNNLSFDSNWKPKVPYSPSIANGFKDWWNVVSADDADARAGWKMIGGITGVALAIPTIGQSITWLGGGSLLFSGNELASGINEATDNSDKEKNLMKSGFEYVGGEAGGDVYDYTELSFGIISLGQNSVNSYSKFKSGDLNNSLKDAFGASKDLFDLSKKFQSTDKSE